MRVLQVVGEPIISCLTHFSLPERVAKSRLKVVATERPLVKRTTIILASQVTVNHEYTRTQPPEPRSGYSVRFAAIRSSQLLHACLERFRCDGFLVHVQRGLHGLVA